MSLICPIPYKYVYFELEQKIKYEYLSISSISYFLLEAQFMTLL